MSGVRLPTLVGIVTALALFVLAQWLGFPTALVAFVLVPTAFVSFLLYNVRRYYVG